MAMGFARVHQLQNFVFIGNHDFGGLHIKTVFWVLMQLQIRIVWLQKVTYAFLSLHNIAIRV